MKRGRVSASLLSIQFSLNRVPKRNLGVFFLNMVQARFGVKREVTIVHWIGHFFLNMIQSRCEVKREVPAFLINVSSCRVIWIMASNPWPWSWSPLGPPILTPITHPSFLRQQEQTYLENFTLIWAHWRQLFSSEANKKGKFQETENKHTFLAEQI